MAKKYEFIKNGLDDYTLKYKDKEIQFCSKVEFIKELQEVQKNARLKMISDLAKEGMSIQDLIIKKTEGAKTIEDHSNKDYVEQGYIQQEQVRVIDNICKKLFNMDASTLILDLGFTEEKEVEDFYKEFGDILAGSLPRG
jgi:hypothetical protein